MGSGIIYYEIEKREKYEDSDESTDLELAVVRTRRYHSDDEPFIHPPHIIQFDPDRPYELLGDDAEGKKVSEEVLERVDDAKGIEEEDKNEEEEEEEEDPVEVTPEEEMPAIPRPMDVDAEEDYLQYLEELRHHPEYPSIHSS
ncbi:hypothetical protein PIB30_080415 [Stylosanthes scabra]|uniref:Uncharacterized protein n=1 Tax=Stylosanthes scabra TaxID=79078 RepID=A0ABU6VQK0_9FABA|nr:hypothetical protein [Stylosanthes scabra]